MSYSGSVLKQQYEEKKELPWHNKDENQLFKILKTHNDGLSEEQVEERQKEYGPNVLPVKEPPSVFTIIIHQFMSPLIYILLAAGVVSLLIGEIIDAGFIFLVIALNASIGSYQEWRAERSAAALQNMLKINARVKRNNEVIEITAEEIVPGDIVYLESGNKIPADLRFLSVNNLSVDESFLTGESIAVNKKTELLDEETLLSDRDNMGFAGATVTAGRGVGVVVSIGMDTEVGRIADTVTSSEATKPPLVIRMERFAHHISFIVIGASALLAFIAILKGFAYTEVFFLAVALTVSAIPEGLPIALTVALSIATTRMAKRNVIVRKLTAVESLGSCTMVASDKTGTLTVNEQTVKLIKLPDGKEFKILGQGYSGEGKVVDNEDNEMIDNNLKHLLENIANASVISNEGSLVLNNNEWKHSGDAMDVALLAYAYKVSVKPEQVFSNIDTVDEIPFESERRYAARFYKNKDSEEINVAVKGAIESVLAFCDKIQTENGEMELHNKNEIEKQALTLSENGYRVLVIADGVVENTKDNYDEQDLKSLTLLGLVGFIDPLRPEVAEAVETSHNAGVKVIMITGDHPATALVIARELGIAKNWDNIITGSELEAIESTDSPEYFETIRNKTVFARVTPLQKLDIVDALQKMGHFVAVTGDGVNDAPALRRANIGVAMGSGTDVAKDTSSMIVTDDNFASIIAGIEEGRFAYDNVRKVIFLLISTGAAEVVLITLAILLGLPIPLLAVQLLWLNLVTNGIQDVALAFEAGEPGAMKRPPRKPEEGIFNSLMIQQTLVSGIWIGLLAFGAWYWLLAAGWEENTARNAILLLMVLLQNVHVFNARSERVSAFKIPLKKNVVLVFGVLAAHGIHILAINIPFMQQVLRAQPVSFNEWISFFVLALSILVVMEFYKYLRGAREAIKTM